MSIKRKLLSIDLKNLFLSLIFLAFSPMSHAILVDTELALVIDISGSVDATDYQLQMDGYQAAFNNAIVQSNIDSLDHGIAVEVFFFSDSAAVGGIEALLTSAADSTAFATTIGNLARPFSGGTNPAAGIALAIDWINNNNYESSNQIIDVSGDGSGTPSADQAQRDIAEGLGIAINGIAIDDRTFFNDECSATGYYTLNIITTGGLCYQAEGFGDFERAIIAKIQAETSSGEIPAPTPVALLGLGLGLLGFARRKVS